MTWENSNRLEFFQFWKRILQTTLSIVFTVFFFFLKTDLRILVWIKMIIAVILRGIVATTMLNLEKIVEEFWTNHTHIVIRIFLIHRNTPNAIKRALFPLPRPLDLCIKLQLAPWRKYIVSAKFAPFATIADRDISALVRSFVMAAVCSTYFSPANAE